MRKSVTRKNYVKTYQNKSLRIIINKFISKICQYQIATKRVDGIHGSENIIYYHLLCTHFEAKSYEKYPKKDFNITKIGKAHGVS